MKTKFYILQLTIKYQSIFQYDLSLIELSLYFLRAPYIKFERLRREDLGLNRKSFNRTIKYI